MLRGFCAVAVLLLATFVQADRIVYTSGAPAYAIDTASQNPASPQVVKMGFVSGNSGGSNTQRWTATPFHLAYADNVNAIEFAWTNGSTTASSYGYRIYKADGAGGAPNTVVTSGSGSLSSLTYTRNAYPTGFEVDNYARITITTAVLAAGDYWITIYGSDGELVWYGGCPGGLNKGYNYRRTTSASSYGQYTIAANDTRIPNYGLGGMYDTIYPIAGPNPNDIYQTAFSLIATGSGGTQIKGAISEPGWSMLPSYSLTDGTPQVYELRLIDPATGTDAGVHSFAVDASGNFTIGPVTSGIYNIIVRSVSSYVGKFGLYNANGSPISEQSVSQAIAAPFLGVEIDGVSVGGSTANLGTITLTSGDVDLNGIIDLFDINSVIVNFGYDSTVAPVPDGYLAAADVTGDRKIDLFDLNAILTNFGLTGPHR